MPILAMRLARVAPRPAVPAPTVLAMCNRLQVLGIDASTIPAEVIQVHPVRDRASQQLVHRAMGKDSLVSSLNTCVPIPKHAHLADPLPARLHDNDALPHPKLVPLAVDLPSAQCHDRLTINTNAAPPLARLRASCQGNPASM